MVQYVKPVASKITERCNKLKLKARADACTVVLVARPVPSADHILSGPFPIEEKDYMRWPVRMKFDVSDLDIISMWKNTHVD